MKKYAPRVTAALLAFAVGVSLAALPALFSGVRVSFRHGWSGGVTEGALTAVAAAACYVLVARGYREPWRDILSTLLRTLLLAFGLCALAVLFTFGAEVFD